MKRVTIYRKDTDKTDIKYVETEGSYKDLSWSIADNCLYVACNERGDQLILEIIPLKEISRITGSTV